MVREIMVLPTLIALHACADPGPIPLIDLTQIAGRSESEVAVLLGDPTGMETVPANGRSFPKKFYRGGDVVFVDGRADWITGFGEGKLPFSNDVLAYFGLPDAPPTFSNPPLTIRWENISGLREVNIFHGQNGYADYAHILVSTQP